MSEFIMMNGIRIVPHYLLSEPIDVLFRFPKSKKKRIRNKWMKDRRNWKKGKEQGLISGDTVYVTPQDYERIKKQLNARNY